MITTSRRPARAHPGRLRPNFDRLEIRLALSTGDPGLTPPANLSASAISELAVTASDAVPVVAVDPAPGSVVTTAPAAITVTFGGPFDPGSMYGPDFGINVINADGTVAPISSNINITETPSADGTSIAITTDQPLAPGHYQVTLLGIAGLATLDGTPVNATGSDQAFEDFTIRPPGVGLGDAVNLGAITSTTTTATGTLDVAANPGDVKLYRVELPAGQTWRLGVELDAASIGSPLHAALSLFDANGHPIATDQTGRPGTPFDPYLFAGLGTGTYYIGVSGQGNLPGRTGGYDPATASPGQATAGLSSGAFDLKVVADAATPTHVKTFFLNYADPTDPTPTGLTVQFDGPINEQALRGNPEGAITLVDQAGKSWPAYAVGYDEATASVSFLFAETLPQGRYLVNLPGQGSLTDLAGRMPISGALPHAMLGAFSVGAQPPKSNPNDLGPIALQDVWNGIAKHLTLGPDETVTYRMVITAPGLYDFATTFDGGAPTLAVSSGGITHVLDAGVPGVLEHHYMQLKPGVLAINITGGEKPTHLGLTIKLPGVSFDQLLDNGVGQSAALDLRLISPDSLSAGASASAGSNGEGPSAAAGAIALGVSGPAATGTATAAPTATSSDFASTSSGASAAVYLAAASGPVGHPTTESESVSVVGPTTSTGIAALASSASGLPQGYGLGQRGRTSPALNAGAIDELLEPTVGEAVADSGAAKAMPAAEPPTAGAADTVVAEGTSNGNPGVLQRAASAVAGWLPGASAGDAEAGAADLDDAALAALDHGRRNDRPEAEEQVEAADLSGTIGLGVIAIAAAHYHRHVARWLGRAKSRIAVGRREEVKPDPRRPVV